MSGCKKLGGLRGLRYLREAGDVEGLELRESGEQESAGAAGGIEDSELGEAVIEGVREIRLVGVKEQSLSELGDIEIASDAVIDSMNGAGGEGMMEVGVVGAAAGIFAPCLAG